MYLCWPTHQCVQALLTQLPTSKEKDWVVSGDRHIWKCFKWPADEKMPWSKCLDAIIITMDRGERSTVEACIDLGQECRHFFVRQLSFANDLTQVHLHTLHCSFPYSSKMMSVLWMILHSNSTFCVERRSLTASWVVFYQRKSYSSLSCLEAPTKLVPLSLQISLGNPHLAMNLLR